MIFKRCGRRENYYDRENEYITTYKGFDICRDRETGEIYVLKDKKGVLCERSYAKDTPIEEIKKEIDEEGAGEDGRW